MLARIRRFGLSSAEIEVVDDLRRSLGIQPSSDCDRRSLAAQVSAPIEAEVLAVEIASRLWEGEPIGHGDHLDSR